MREAATGLRRGARPSQPPPLSHRPSGYRPSGHRPSATRSSATRSSATAPQVCAEWLAVSAYPSIVLLNRKHGTVQRYPEAEPRTPEAIRTWALAVAAEWRYLFAASNVTRLDAASFGGAVLRGSLFWVVMFTDGLVCSQCRTAATNLMRLSASLRGLPVGVGLVDCEQPRNAQLCYHTHQLPPPPHRPLLKVWRSGDKRADSAPAAAAAMGEPLYNANLLESHVALEMAERLLRLALHDRIPPETEAASDAAAADPRHASGGRYAEHEEPPRPEGPSRPDFFRWDGPAMRHKPLPWGGPSRPDQAMLGQ